MNHTLFTVEEENLICAFDTSSRTSLTSGIRDAMPYFETDEPVMLEIAETALAKLDAMGDEEYSSAMFTPAYGGGEESGV